MCERRMKRGESQTFEIPGKLPGFNEFTAQNRRNPYTGARLKRQAQDCVIYAAKAARLRKFSAPVHVHITYIEPNMKRDKDNISSGGRKIILDALVKLGIIGNDNWHWIGNKEDSGQSDSFRVNKNNPRVVVRITQL